MPDVGTAPGPRVVAYHAEVDAAVEELEAVLAQDGVDAAVGALDRALTGPAARDVLDPLARGRDALLEEARRELTEPRRSVPSNPSSRAGLVKVLLLHQVDARWWSHEEPYADAAAVQRDSGLVRLDEFDRARLLSFRFARQPTGLPGRARDYALRRVAPRRRPQVSGMKFLVARREMVALLDELAAAFRTTAPRGTPPLWVNSLVRSVAHQRHLADLGYPALLPSSHCCGWGADLEMRWYAEFGADVALRDLLLDYRDREVLNVIDEGQAWHVCLNPAHVGAYATSGA